MPQAQSSGVRIVRFDNGREDHGRAFRELNLAWILKDFALEDRDKPLLYDPQGSILDQGGQILVAELEGNDGVEVVGACALLPHGHRVVELAKMAVKDTARGRGIGRALGEAAIDAARVAGARRIELTSNTVLAPAIRLYESLGFVHIPLPKATFARANVRMALDLSPRPRRGG